MDSFDKMFTFRKEQKPLVKPSLLTGPPPKHHVVGPDYNTEAAANWARYYTRDDLVATTYMDSSSRVMRPAPSQGYAAANVPKHAADMPTPAWPMPEENQYKRQPHPGYGYGYGPANIPPGYAAMAWRQYQNMLQQQQNDIYIGAPGSYPGAAPSPNRVGVKTMVADPVQPWDANPAPIDYTSLSRRSYQPQPVTIEQGDNGNMGMGMNNNGMPPSGVYSERPVRNTTFNQPYGQQALPNSYRVQPGDSLSSISGQDQIYGNWQMWPLIYDANRTQINDPDLIFPQQNLGIPRGYSQQQAQDAQRRAAEKTPPYDLYDGF
jgi:nucleoid-associated protein YgaU